LFTSRFHTLLCVPSICIIAWISSASFGAESDDDAGTLAARRAEVMKTYNSQVSPFITNYCGRCHTGNRQRGGVTFSSALRALTS